ncbi:MAG: helix-turn-helix transcriptional regulator [Alphaproteobacteria bacterium]|nr:MAG: helix-turn-helix transcriptional regulator [Alphaproteobacteria bacterium]
MPVACHGEAPTAVRSVADVRPAAEALRDIAFTAARLRVAACANIAAKEPMVDGDGNVLAASIFGWPESAGCWWKKPILALNSPLPIACRYEAEAFWCNADGLHLRYPNELLDGFDLSNFSSFVNGPAAIVVPVHLPFGQIGAVSFTPYEDDRNDLGEEFERFGHMLEEHARRFIATYVKVMTRRPWVPSNFRLSKREVECLRWAAAGKTDYEISLIISRSCATVRFHIQNAARKLQAVNRSQTVFKAAQLGYLGDVAVAAA